MNDVQSKIRELIEKYKLETSLGDRFIDLVSEVGELGKEILKGNDYGKKEFSETDNFKSELGDVLFSLICIANSLNVNLDTVLEEVLKKYENRFSEKGNIGSGR